MTASPTPPDFFAESAKNPDHIVDADKMVPAGLPSEEEMTMLVDGAAYYGADSRSVAHAILALIRPAFEAKEREIEQVKATRDSYYRTIEMQAQENSAYLDHWQFSERRALSAEAALAAERKEGFQAGVDKVCNTRLWTVEMSHAWHRAVPFFPKAFEDLAAAIRSQEQP